MKNKQYIIRPSNIYRSLDSNPKGDKGSNMRFTDNEDTFGIIIQKGVKYILSHFPFSLIFTKYINVFFSFTKRTLLYTFGGLHPLQLLIDPSKVYFLKLISLILQDGSSFLPSPPVNSFLNSDLEFIT